jgi:Tetratricopeptide repeat
MYSYRSLGRYKRLSVFVVLMLLTTLLAACGDQNPTPTVVAPTAVSSAPATGTPAAAQETPTTAAVENPTAPSTNNQASDTPTTAASGQTTSDAATALAQGIDAYGKGDYDGAIAAFTQAIQASPQFYEAYLDRGVAYFAKGQSQQALDDLNKAYGIKPSDPYPVFAIGLLFYKSGDFATAQKAFSLMVQNAPAEPAGYFWRANTYVNLKNPTAAFDDYSQVIKLSAGSDMGNAAQAAIDQLAASQDVTLSQVPTLAVVEGTPPPPAQPAEAAGKGAVVADLGFRPNTDGFKFENYGAQPDRTDLTPDDMRRMFGDQVCASTANGCILTPEAQQWMESANEGAGGGHCEGFAALSVAMYQRKEDPSKFGAASTHDLNIDGNTALQRELAYFWATQLTNPVVNNRIQDKTPSEILDTLIDAYKAGKNATTTYTIEFFKPGFKEGHAVTPYAIEDRGNGVFAVRIYDNNIPDTERIMLIDRNANSWIYEAAINPGVAASVYRGDATTHTLFLTPSDPRFVQQVCTFCPGGGTSRVNGVAAPATEYNQVFLDGDAHLLITDSDGHRTGYVSDDNFVNEIPGVEVQPLTSANLWEDNTEPVYFVPTGVEFSLVVQSTNPTTNTLSTVTMIGPGYDLSVEDIVLEPNTSDSIDFSSDGKTIVYKTDYSDTPDIVLGTNGKDADFSFDLAGVDIGSGGSVTARLDTDKGQLVLDAKNNVDAGTYSLTMDRIDDAGEQVFGHDQIELKPGDTAYLNYEEWKGNGEPLQLQIDNGSDGTIDQTLELTDVH